MESKPLVPKLRFPAFRGKPGWKSYTIGDVVNLNYGESLSDQHRHSGTVPVMGSNGIVGYHDEALIQGPAIVIGRKGSVGRITWIETDCFPIDTTYFVKNKNPKTTSLSFLYRLLHVSDLGLRGDSSTIPGLNRNEVHSIRTALPELAEQHKIAECLTSLDELIRAEGRKLEALRTHKKGLMQNLFPREGETTPRLRFPEFRDADEWEEKTLGDFADVLMCKRIFASDTNPSTGVPFYKIGTLGSVPDAYINEDLFRSYRSKYKFPRKGEVLITCSGSIGKCLVYDGEDAYYQDSNIVWIDNPNCIVTNELLYLILSAKDWGKLNSTTITRIYCPDLRGLTIRFPENESEQQCIADFFASLDVLVTEQVKKLDSLKLHKEGLMQGLFPSQPITTESERSVSDKPDDLKDALSASHVPNLGEGNGS